MRGQRNLYQKFQEPVLDINKSLKPGRSSLLIQKRNEALSYRYYFYHKIKRNNYEDCITSLANEFFLSSARTIELLVSDRCSRIIKSAIKNEMTIEELTKQFFYLNWKL